MRQRKGSAGGTPDVRGTIRKIADGEPYTVPATIADPLIPSEIKEALAEKGFPKH
jgi:propionyl-CoA synthetase